MRLFSPSRFMAFFIGLLLATMLVPTHASAQQVPPRSSGLDLQLSPKFVWVSHGDTQNSAGTVPQTNGSPIVEYQAKYTFDNRHDQLFLTEHYLRTTIGRILIPTPRGDFSVYPGDGADLLYIGGYERWFNKNFGLAAGYRERYRGCCPGDSQPGNTNPAGWGGPFLEADYATRPYTKARIVIGGGARFVYALNHNIPPPGAELFGVPYQHNQWLCTDCALYITAVGNPSFIPYLVDINNGEDFRNQPGVQVWHFIIAGIQHDINKNVDVRFQIENTHQFNNGGNAPASVLPTHFTNVQIFLDLKTHFPGR